jgi:ppGpp synthetase/RelA/SpoT-type nucleotidyltranferase
MAASDLTKVQRRMIRGLVSHYEENQDIASQLLEILRSHILGDKALRRHIHSVKSRVKDPKRLKDKLERKLLKTLRDNKKFTIDKSNLFVKINDLAGFRILHLHTRQLRNIHEALLGLFTRERYVLREKPFARTWDDESRAYFKSIGIKTLASPSMYTSVHYVINSNSQIKATCEIQVRTLMEEVWGEVDHAINYPHPIRSVACGEQIKALARATSSATRLVDSIFSSYDDHVRAQQAAQARRRKGKKSQKP